MKAQIILKFQDENGIHFIKKWREKYLSIEGHSVDRAKQHNLNTPAYFFPITEEDCERIFKENGKIYVKTNKENNHATGN